MMIRVGWAVAGKRLQCFGGPNDGGTAQADARGYFQMWGQSWRYEGRTFCPLHCYKVSDGTRLEYSGVHYHHPKEGEQS